VTERDFVSLMEKAKVEEPSGEEEIDFVARIQEKKAKDRAKLSDEEKGFFDRVRDYFTEDKFGEALTMQMKSGGFAQAPSLTPEQALEVGTEVGTIAAVEAAFAPLIGVAGASAIAPRILTALTRLTQAGATGAATATTRKLVKEGELPSTEELLKEGLTWAAIDGIMQSIHVGFDFGHRGLIYKLKLEKRFRLWINKLELRRR